MIINLFINIKKMLTKFILKPTLQNTFIMSRGFAWTPVQKPIKNWNIVREDNVEVIAGRYKKTQGRVLHVNRKKNQVTVKGVNLKYLTVNDEEMVRRTKVVQKEFPIHVSNVSLIDPETG